MFISQAALNEIKDWTFMANNKQTWAIIRHHKEQRQCAQWLKVQTEGEALWKYEGLLKLHHSIKAMKILV